MSDNNQRIEDLEDEIIEYLSDNSDQLYFDSLKGIIIKLAIDACVDSQHEIKKFLEELIVCDQSSEPDQNRRTYLSDIARRDIDKAIKENGADSREAWAARLIFNSLHRMPEDNDTLLTLIFEYSTVSRVDSTSLSNILMAYIDGFGNEGPTV